MIYIFTIIFASKWKIKKLEKNLKFKKYKKLKQFTSESDKISVHAVGMDMAYIPVGQYNSNQCKSLRFSNVQKRLPQSLRNILEILYNFLNIILPIADCPLTAHNVRSGNVHFQFASTGNANPVLHHGCR